MANVQMPVLFTISDSTGATLFGEEVANDLIENHLSYSLDRAGAFHSAGYDLIAGTATSTLQAAFKDTFYVGDSVATANAGDENKLFYFNMIGGVGTTAVAKKTLPDGTTVGNPGQVVDMFCNKLADAILKVHNNKGLVHNTAGGKTIPIGGKADATQQSFTSSVAPSESEQLDVGAIMARVASVHLVGHPLAQAIFADEDTISANLTTPPGATVANGIFTSNLARLLSHALGGSQAVEAKRLKAGNNIDELVKMTGEMKAQFDAANGANASSLIQPLNSGLNGVGAGDEYHYNLKGVPASNGIANPALKSLLEQLLNISGRAAKLNDVRGTGYQVKKGGVNYAEAAFNGMPTLVKDDAVTMTAISANTITAPFPIEVGDTLSMFVRPKLKLKFETTVTGDANIAFVDFSYDANGAITGVASVNASQDTSGLSTTTGAASGVAAVFPGYVSPAAGAVDQATADAYQAGKYGWMGSANTNTNAANKKRSVTQITTDITDADIMDQHVWKIKLTL